MGGSRSRPYVCSLMGWLLHVDQGKERRKGFPTVEPKRAKHAKRRGGKKAAEGMRDQGEKTQHSRKPLPCILGPDVYDSGVVSGFLYLTAFQGLPEPGNGSWGEVELCWKAECCLRGTEILGCCLQGKEILPAGEKGALRPSCLQKPGLLALLDLRERLISFTWSASLASPSLPSSPTRTDSQNSLPLDSRN